MIVYLDTSLILRVLFGQGDAYADWGEWRSAYTSELTLVEGLRTIDRLRLQQKIQDAEVADKIQGLHAILEYVGEIALSPSVLQRASEPHPTLINTLDAIHLASAYLWKQQYKKDLHFLTHDVQLGTAAKALGFPVAGV